MICNFCGNKIDDASEFCVICGQKATDEKTEATNENVFSQVNEDSAAETPAVAVEETAPEVEATEEVAQTETTVEALEEVEGGKKGKKTKKKKPVGFFMKILCFISTIISLLTYSKATKKGNEARQEAVMNLLGLSVCWKLAAVVVYLVMTYVL